MGHYQRAVALLRSGWVHEKVLEVKGQTQDNVELDIDCNCPRCTVFLESIGEAAVTFLFPVVSLKCWVSDSVGLVRGEGAYWKAGTSFSV